GLLVCRGEETEFQSFWADDAAGGRLAAERERALLEESQHLCPPGYGHATLREPFAGTTTSVGLIVPRRQVTPLPSAPPGPPGPPVCPPCPTAGSGPPHTRPGCRRRAPTPCSGT